jgi:hypothetical protein
VHDRRHGIRSRRATTEKLLLPHLLPLPAHTAASARQVRVREERREAEALARVALQQRQQQRPPRRVERDVRRKRQRVRGAVDVREQLDVVRAAERRLPRGHLVQDGADGPEVRLGPVPGGWHQVAKRAEKE